MTLHARAAAQVEEIRETLHEFALTTAEYAVAERAATLISTGAYRRKDEHG